MGGPSPGSAGPAGCSGVVAGAVGAGMPVLAQRGKAPRLVEPAAYVLATGPRGRSVGLTHEETGGVWAGVRAMVLTEADLAPGYGLCPTGKRLVVQRLVFCSPAETAGGCRLPAIKTIVRHPFLAVKCACTPHNAPQICPEVRDTRRVSGTQDSCHKAVALDSN